MEKHKQQEVWNGVALSWAEFRTRPVEEVKEFLKGKQGKVLDLGCGSGRNFIGNKELEFFGVDFSKKLLGIAKEKDYVELKKGTVDNIPYDNEFFDWVVFVRVLHCVEGRERREKTLKEIYNVLKKGGEAVISTIGGNNQRVKNKPKEGIMPWTVGRRKYERYNYIYDKEELEKELKKAGFKILQAWENQNINVVIRK